MSYINKTRTDNEEIVLKKVDSDIFIKKHYSKIIAPDSILVTFLDVETTGVHTSDDEIIEIGIINVTIDKNTGFLKNVIESYSELNDPLRPIPLSATKVNGITDDMVSGKKINWEMVNKILMCSEVIIAHNASFDRAFLDRYLPLSRNKYWGCTMKDVCWINYGFKGVGLELLCAWHGIWYDAHRGLNDVAATVSLVAGNHGNNRAYLLEIMEVATKQYYQVSVKFNYNPKMQAVLKADGYYFISDGKSWNKIGSLAEVENERIKLEQYKSLKGFELYVLEVPPYDRYKTIKMD